MKSRVRERSGQMLPDNGGASVGVIAKGVPEPQEARGTGDR